MPTTVIHPTSDETRVYEIAILLPGSSTDKDKQETLRNIGSLLSERQLTVRERREWRKMGLAYTIKRETQGQYVFFYVEGAPSALLELDSQLKIERGVLRHLVTKLPPHYELTDWEAHYTAWKEGLAKEEEDKAKEHEEALKKKIVQRAIRQNAAPAPKKDEPREKEVVAGEEVSEKEIAEKLGELMSDEDLNL